MRFRLIAVLAALLMLTPAAGFAFTTTPVLRDSAALASSRTKKKHKKKHKKKRKNKKNKRNKKNKKKQPQQIPMPMGG